MSELYSLLPQLISALFLGLLGGLHCIGMCGGLSAALTMAIPEEQRQQKRLPILLSYNLGRISSYACAGALMGTFGWALQQQGSWANIGLRSLAAFMLIAMGLYIGNWWRGLTHLEKLGGKVWKYLRPSAQRLMPVNNCPQAILLGAIWGWLPCGLVYSSLIWAGSSGSASQSAMLMAAFGLGTLPVMLVNGYFSLQLMELFRSSLTRSVVASIIILFGLWTLPGPHQQFISTHTIASE